MVTVEIRGANWRNLKEIRSIVGAARLYTKGTNNPEDYVDFQDLSRAQLAVVNLNLVPGIQARVVGRYS
jgi:hypothetical protein